MSSHHAPLRAQSSPLPTVGITRLTSLDQNVWAAHVNGDDFMDLVGTKAAPPNSGPQPIRILLANDPRSGGYAAPIDLPFDGRVLRVADVNNDGKVDIIAEQAPGPDDGVFVIPGNGDGTFGTPHLVGYPTFVTFADTADFDGDGKNDIVLADIDGDVLVYAGHGDFTYGAPIAFSIPDQVMGGTTLDFITDGKWDFVVADYNAGAISVFTSTSTPGVISFKQTDFNVAPGLTDVTWGDLNRDGNKDLVITRAGGGDGSMTFFTEGQVFVWFGDGRGGFLGAPTAYPTPRGTWRAVVGDFNRDGIVDIATANRSSIVIDDCSRPLKTWDSVSILPGNGDGTFGAASSFSLGNQSNLTSERFKNTVLSLVAADLNGDQALDLVTSWGAILINRPADPNWPPTVTASSTQPSSADRSIVLMAPASDSDQDMLTYSWSDTGGSSIPPVPHYCFTPATFGVHTFTVTVDDQHGHTARSSVSVDFGSGSSGPITVTAPAAGETVPGGMPYTIRWTATSEVSGDQTVVTYSTDNGTTWTHIVECDSTTLAAGQCRWNNPAPDSTQAFVKVCDANPDDGCDTSGRFTIKTSNGNTLPSGWSQSDIGAVTAAGSGSYNSSSGEWTVAGDGADIWGTADAFHYVYTTMSTSAFEVQLRVDSEQAVNAWTKAGIMIRSSLDANAVHASIFVTPSKGIQFQRRTTTGGASISTSEGPDYTAPVWLRMTKIGTTVAAYYRKNLTDPWSQLFSQSMDGLTAGGTVYAGIPVTSHDSGRLATATFSNLLVGPLRTWTCSAIGNTNSRCAQNGTVLTMTNTGADIWGTSDQFVFGWNPITGDGTITARVNDLQATNVWTKAGVMIRADWRFANSPFVDVVATPSRGIAMQFRTTTGGASQNAGIAQVSKPTPGWVRLTRAGDWFTGQWSLDGITWNTVNIRQVVMPPTVYFGMVLTSHDASRSATASFDDMRIQQ